MARVKNGLIPVVAQMMGVWLFNGRCDFVKFVVGYFVQRALPYGSDVLEC